MDEWLTDLERLLDGAVKKTCKPKMGMIFSSGVDSALIAYAASRHCDITSYNVGVEDSDDIRFANRLESEAPFKIKYIPLKTAEVEPAIRDVLRIVRRPNPIDVGVGIPFYLVSKAAKKDGLDAVLCGQGGDELFGGYWRYLECLVKMGAGEVAAWMEKDWANADADNLDRDRAMCKTNNVELRFPYLDREFSDYSRKMPFDLKIREDGDLVCDEIAGRKFARKYALKKLALRVGVPEYIVNRVKRAAQYGSGTNKALERIARSKGYKAKASSAGRNDYLRLYLEDVLASL